MEWCIAVASTGMGIKTRSTQSSRQRINMSGQRYMYMHTYITCMLVHWPEVHAYIVCIHVPPEVYIQVQVHDIV